MNGRKGSEGEKIAANLLSKEGFQIEELPVFDSGTDLYMKKEGRIFAIQVKYGKYLQFRAKSLKRFIFQNGGKIPIIFLISDDFATQFELTKLWTGDKVKLARREVTDELPKEFRHVPVKERVKSITLKCPKCNYEWDYKGKLLAVTCPNCRHIFKRG